MEKPSKRQIGICHQFKSNNNTSKRVKTTAEILNTAVKREVKNSNTLHSDIFRTVISVQDYEKKRFETMISSYNKDKIFFSGKNIKNGQIEKIDYEDIPTIPILENEHLEIHHNNKGSILCVDKGSNDFIFALLPRKKTTNCNFVHKFIESLKFLENCKPNGYNVRGTKRCIVYEDDIKRNNYLTIGLTPRRNGTGIYEKCIPGYTGSSHEECVKKMSNFTAKTVSRYIPHLLKTSMKKILDKIDYQSITDKDSNKHDKNCQIFHNFFPSMASGRNVCLNLHTDEDAFLSVVSVYTSEDIVTSKRKGKEISHIQKNTPIIKYFTFDNGHTVGLRTGDILLFNPLVKHCISTKTDASNERDVYCVSYYFKSLIIGLNDNSIEVDDK